MHNPIRVLIADDHTIVRSGLVMLLGSEPDIEVVGEAIDGQQAVQMAAQLQPDIVLMDIGMPELDGIEATQQIKQTLPEVQVLILTMHRSEAYFFHVLEAGASGYVLKGAETEELLQAIRAVAEGGVFLYPTMARRLVQEYLRSTGEGDPALAQLTPREREVLRLIAEGYSNKEIAEELVLSSSTVHTHRNNLMRKLNLSTRHELVRYARKHGLVRDP